VLSRLAENVYWIGRFIERSDDLGRLVSAYHYSAAQLGSLEEHGGLHDLIEALGDPGDGSTTFRGAASWWVTSEANPSSVASCVRNARERARSVRELLPLEVWEGLNATSGWVDRALATSRGYDTVASEVTRFTRAIAGIVEATMPRDETWEILRLGMMIERAAMTLRAMFIGALADERLDPQDTLALHMWTVTLRATSSLDAYRRTYLALPRAETVADVLIRSATCPRSVTFAIREAQGLVPYGGGAAASLEKFREIIGDAMFSESLSATVGLFLDICDELHHSIVADWRGRWNA
jgi:uncharacterized alpha-E superfamily protein